MQNWEPTYMIKFTNPTNKPGHGKAWWAITFVQDDKILLFDGITWSDQVHRIIQFNIYKVRQLEELCGDCLNIWGRAVFLFNFHESLRWHVLHREQIAQKLRLFIICILIRGTVDSCWATWHVEALPCVFLRAFWGQRQTRSGTSVSIYNELLTKFTTQSGCK